MGRPIEHTETSISISQTAAGKKVIYSRSHLFQSNKELEVMVCGDRLIIKEPTIDYSGKLFSVRTHRKNSGWNIRMVTDKLPIGRCEIDEDESEECTQVYFYEDFEPN